MNPKFGRGLLVVGVILFLVLLPILPVLQAAVIPEPIFRQKWVSLWQIMRIVLYPLPGLQYRFGWSSYISIFLIIVVGIAAIKFITKRRKVWPK